MPIYLLLSQKRSLPMPTLCQKFTFSHTHNSALNRDRFDSFSLLLIGIVLSSSVTVNIKMLCPLTLL